MQLSRGPVRKFFRGKTTKKFSKGGVTKNKKMYTKANKFS